MHADLVFCKDIKHGIDSVRDDIKLTIVYYTVYSVLYTVYVL